MSPILSWLPLSSEPSEPLFAALTIINIIINIINRPNPIKLPNNIFFFPF